MTKLRTVEQNGKTFVLLPLDDYQHMLQKLEDAADVRAFDEAKARNEEAFPIAMFDQIDAGSTPVAALRQYRRMTQSELAKASGLSIPYLCQIETRARKGTTKAMKAIAKALHVDIDMLLEIDIADLN